MSRDKQIEEMAKLIHDAEKTLCHHKSCRECKYGDKDAKLCTEKVTAEYLLDNGYRKSSEVAREIFEELEKHFLSGITPLRLCIYTIGSSTYIKLKKKYTEGEG